MPQVTALKTFNGRLGLIRAGETFHCEDGYFKALQKNGLVAIATNKPAEPGPSNDRNIPNAPGRSGKGETDGQGTPPAQSTVPTQGAGGAITSSSLQADQASRRKTLPLSAPGARKGTPTPRKGKKPADV